MKRLQSVDNPRVKEAVKLRDRRARTRARRFLVEGRRELFHALDQGWRPTQLFVEPQAAAAVRDDLPAAAPLQAAAERLGASLFEVTPTVYGKLALREGSAGLLGVFEMPDLAPEALKLPPSPLVLLAHGIEKPGNVGALLRSADAFAADAFVVEGGTDLWNPNVVRASLGCLFTVPLAVLPPGGADSWLEASGLSVVAATPDGERRPADVDFTGGVALLVGSEERGLPDTLLRRAATRVRIPMHGRADSLNVSVSAGVLLYEADRQRAARG